MRFVIPTLSRRQRKPLVAIAIVAVAATGLAAVSRTPFAARTWPGIEQHLVTVSANTGFRVRAVQVEGRERASAKDILAALGVARGTPIFSVDPVTARERLQSVPWVKTASIYRRLPDTLLITMTEQEPLAFWQRDGKLVLIDRDGRPIETQDLGGFSRLPVLVGEDAPRYAEALLAMLDSEPKLAEQVAAAVRVGARRWNIQFKNGIAAALPELEADHAWHRLAAIENSHRILERRVLLVDMRLPDRIYLKLPPELMPKPPGKKHSHADDPV